MRSFIYSAIKLSIAKPDVHCVSPSITDDEQFDHITTGDVYFCEVSREDQINYLLLIAAEQGEFENSFIYSSLILANSDKISSLTSKHITSDDQYSILCNYKEDSCFESCWGQSKQFNIDFALLIAAAKGEI